MSRRRFVQAVLASSAAAGLVGAHLIAYMIALPNAGVRSALLRTTGHGYFSTAVVVATVAGIFGVLTAATLGFRAGEPDAGITLRWRAAAIRIATVQTTAFLVLEVSERAAANISPVALDPRLVAIGVAVQLALATLAALIVTLIARVAAVIAGFSLLRSTETRSARPSVPLPTDREPRAIFAGAGHARAPPLTPR